MAADAAPLMEFGPGPGPGPGPELALAPVGGTGAGTGIEAGVAKLLLSDLGAVFMAPAMEPLPMLPHVLLGGCGVRNSCIGICPK